MKIYRILYPEITTKHGRNINFITHIKEKDLDNVLRKHRLEPIILREDTSKYAISILLRGLVRHGIIILKEGDYHEGI